MRNGLAVGAHDLGTGVAAGAALGVQEGLDHLDGVEGALAEGAHGLGGAEEGRVVAIVGHLIEVGHGLLQLAGRDAERGLKLRDGGGGDDLILKAGRDAVVLGNGLVLGGVPHHVGVARALHVHPVAVARHVSVAVVHVLAQVTLAAVAHDDDAAGEVAQVVERLGVLILVHHEGDAAEREAVALIGLHVPQIGADAHGHLHAVAGVEQGAGRRALGEAQEVLDHLLVVLEAAHGHDDAVLGADVHGLAGLVDLHADDGAADRILEELRGRGHVPHVDVVAHGHDLVAVGLPQRGVAHVVAHGQHVQRLAAFELGVLGDEHGDHRLGGGVLLPIEEVLLGDAEEVAQHGLRLGEALGVGVHELVVDGEIAGHGLVVGEHGLLVVGVQDDLAAEARVAALHALRGLIDEQHLRAGVGGVAGGHGTGTAEADDDDVVLAVPSDGVGEGGSPVARVGHGLIGRGLRRAAGKAEAGDGGHADTSAGDELSAGIFSHFPLPCGRCLRAGLMSGEDVA